MKIFEKGMNAEDMRAQVKDLGLYGPARYRLPWETVAVEEPRFTVADACLYVTVTFVALMLVTGLGR